MLKSENYAKIIEIEKQILGFSGLQFGNEIEIFDVILNDKLNSHIHTTLCGHQNSKIMVLIHGYGGSNFVFTKMLKDLSKDHKVYSIDLLGMGLSSRVGTHLQTKDDVINFFVDSIEQWRSSLCIKEMILVGHSFGGMISSFYALKYTHRIKQLILISPAGISNNHYDVYHPNNMKQQSLTAQIQLKFELYCWQKKWTPFDLIRNIGMLQTLALKNFIKTKFGKIFNDKERKLICKYYKEMIKLPIGSEESVFIMFNPNFNAVDPIEKIFPKDFGAPITFFYGASDWMDPTGALNILVKLGQEKCRVIIIKDAGHQIILENTKDLTKNILEEIQRHSVNSTSIEFISTQNSNLKYQQIINKIDNQMNSDIDDKISISTTEDYKEINEDKSFQIQQQASSTNFIKTEKYEWIF